ncbi:uncharacterized protein N7484_001453 [Penicillium longicatenatum]|uniref:uncharacterized protein n=1 Tax=Penicillium longicatenatum TaxID=1561947 RepID=UPI002548F75B|nr:uncharacterized protein N7484_001453 [Penicillium longicatenatum]KAJ5657804.1 hypothetical protein N7484_001453 [Penicillium longicatenatum]
MVDTSSSQFIVEGFSLLGVSIFLIALRIVARWAMVGWKNFQADDYLMVLAGVVYAMETAAAYAVVDWYHGLANSSMTDEQRASLSPDSDEYRWRVGGSKVQVIGWSLYVTTLWLLKACMAIFYSRLTDGLPFMRIRILISYASIAVTYVVVLVVILAGCHPMHRNWQIYPNPGSETAWNCFIHVKEFQVSFANIEVLLDGCQPAVAKLHIYFTVILNAITDIELMSIPIPMLMKAKMRWREKARLLVLFSGGLFVMTAGILRCALILTGGSRSAAEGAAWARRESFVAVAVGNFPMIYPLVRRLARKAGLIVSQGSSRDYPRQTQSQSALQSQSRKKNSYPLVSRKNNEWNELDDELISLDTGRKEPTTHITANSDWDRDDVKGQGPGI